MCEITNRDIFTGVECETYPVLSTAHVTLLDSQMLDKLCDDIEQGVSRPPEGIAYLEKQRYGWRVKVYSDAGDAGMADRMRRDLARLHLSEAFQDLMVALLRGVHAGLIIDRDGEQYDHIPAFNWG